MKMKLSLFVVMIFSMTVFAQRIPIKNVAVIETQIDDGSDAASKINRAEVRGITNEIRREAVNNLPRGRFNVMTSETVQSMGDAVLEECAEENCVIALGSKIGADYIVRGIISTFAENLTVTVEMYETEYGMLVATAASVRTANLNELLERTAVVCAEMYRKFLEGSLPQASLQTVGVKSQPAPETKLESESKQEKGRRWYLGVKYLPMSSSAYWSGGNLEFGVINHNEEVFLGIDLSVAIRDTDEKYTGMAGLGLNLGAVHRLTSELKLVYGSSFGYWFHWLEDNSDLDAYGYAEERESHLFGGLFVKLRYKYLEFSYRTLIGTSKSKGSNRDFGISHQLGLGLYLEF